MITRRSVLLAGGIGLLVAHRLIRGQPAATIRRVGMLSLGSEAAADHLRGAFMQGMHDLGWLEGKNVQYRFVYANGDLDRLDALVGELIGEKAEVILLSSQQAASAAKRATKTIPIVMANLADPVGTGFVASLAKPGGNITGITSQRQRSQAVVVTSDGMYFAERAKLQELMQTIRLPVAYGLREFVVAGGLLSYGADLAANYRYAAKYVDKILKGAKPADLPVEQATKFKLVIKPQDCQSAWPHDSAVAAAARG